MHLGPRGTGVLAACLLLLSVLLIFVSADGELLLLRAGTAYGNYDAAPVPGALRLLSPGVSDYAAKKTYLFGEGLHLAPLAGVGAIFLVLLLLVLSPGRKTSRTRGLVQWAAFVITRMGVLRASQLFPLRRCSLGVLPFLNCHACEMAVGACPVGALQLSLVNLSPPLLVAGVVILWGVALGRWVCGWLCPFGLLSDLLGRLSLGRWSIPPRWRAARFWVLGLLAAGSLAMGLAAWRSPLPFCSTVCPSGALFGLLPYYVTTAAPAFAGFPASLSLGWISAHALVLLAAFGLALLAFGRAFCSFLCPCGALLGLLEKVSLVKIEHRESSCSGCGACRKGCPMGLDLGAGDFQTRSSCIRCGACVEACRSEARAWSMGPSIGGHGAAQSTQTKESP